MMKKAIAIVCCLLWTAAFAQNIPADSLDSYRKEAHRMLIDQNTSEAVELYKRLTLSGDALSGYQLYELYSQGQGVPKDEAEAKKWQTMAQEILAKKTQQSRLGNTSSTKERSKPNDPQSLEYPFDESGRLIAKGAMEHNSAIVVGLLGGTVGGVLTGVGISQQSTGAKIAGGIIAGGCGVAALVLTIVGNKHIKQGGELMRRVQIKGNGISVSF